MRAAVIDIGSDIIRLLIGEENKPNIRVIELLQNPLPIGRSTFLTGRIDQDMVTRTISILKKYQKIIAQYEVETVKAVATTAVREARNREIFLDTVFRKTGLEIEVLNVGDVVFYSDSYLSYSLEKSYPVHEKNLLIAELGGGSLDVSVMRKGLVLMNVGLSIGTMRLKQLLNQLDGSHQEVFYALEEHIENELIFLKKSIPRIQIDDIILIDENYFYFQNLLPQKEIKTDFFQLTQKDIQDILKDLSDKSPEAISRDYKMPFEIAETLESYAIVLKSFFKITEKKYIYILQTSLSEAILASLFSDMEVVKKYNKQNQLISAAVNLCHLYNADLAHAKHVALLSKVFFDALKEHLGLEEKEGLYLILASYLHDIGIFINNRAHHKHAEYIINSLSFFRLTQEEVKMIACIARYHRRAIPTKTHLLYNSLLPKEQIVIQKLSAILRITNALDRSHKQKIKQAEVSLSESGDIQVVVRTNENLLLERVDFMAKKKFFEEVTGNRITLIAKE